MNTIKSTVMAAVIALGTSAIAVPASATVELKPSPEAKTATKKTTSKRKSFKRLPTKPNGSGVIVSYRLEGKPAVGKPLTITLLMEGINAADAQVSIAPADGMSMAKTISQQALRKGTNNRMQVSVTPSAEGRSHLNITTTQDGKSSMSAVVVDVGAVKLKANGRVTTNANGETVVSMPSKQ